MKTFGLATAMLAVTAWVSVAQADMYGFTNITGNNLTNAATGEAQFTLDVTEVGGRVQFEFGNTGPNPSRIALLAFESGGVLGSFFGLIEGAGVDFQLDASPGNLPGGNSLSPQFTEAFTASRAPGAANGVDPGETVAVIYNLISGKTFADVISALNDESLRVGIHVTSFGFFPGDTVDRGSESFIVAPLNGPPPDVVIPAPSAVILGGLGLTMVGLRQRRRLSL